MESQFIKKALLATLLGLFGYAQVQTGFNDLVVYPTLNTMKSEVVSGVCHAVAAPLSEPVAQAMKENDYSAALKGYGKSVAAGTIILMAANQIDAKDTDIMRSLCKDTLKTLGVTFITQPVTQTANELIIYPAFENTENSSNGSIALRYMTAVGAGLYTVKKAATIGTQNFVTHFVKLLLNSLGRNSIIAPTMILSYPHINRVDPDLVGFTPGVLNGIITLVTE